ncbi:TetR/AcrR family transcriptional regulator [Promicromonospora sp. NFX87]|uniref:TetR/AcrR family transcriptional regulator n=1 Tax=Promicromonospora sp. NFX87 TaxID=3402691 RepID=UPI003AFA83BA
MERVEPALERDTARARIVDAAAELLRDGGARAVTTRAVAERAGFQAPTIYRHFGDKDGLVQAVAEAAMEKHSAAKAVDADDDLDPAAALRAAWHRHIDFGLANPDLYVMLAAHTHEQLSPATAKGIEMLRRHVARMASAGLLVVSERRAVDMIHATGNGTVLALIAQPAQNRDLGLVDMVFDAVLAAISRHSQSDGDLPHGTLTALVHVSAVIDELSPLTTGERGLLAEWIQRCITALETPDRA